MLQWLAAAVLVLCGCKSDCKDRVARLRDRLAPLKGSPKPEMPVWEADGTGRTPGAMRVRVLDSATTIAIDDGPSQSFVPYTVVAEAQRRGHPVIELEAPGSLKGYGDLVATLMTAGDLHIMVQRVVWPADADTEALSALRKKLVRTVDDQSFYAFGDAYRSIVGETCREGLDKAAADIRALPYEQQAEPIKQAFASRIAACDCKATDVESVSGLVSLFILPQYETAWVHIAPGTMTISTDYTLDTFVSNALMFEPTFRQQGFKLLAPRR